MTKENPSSSNINKFADKYINFFEKEFGRTRESYYRFFDDNEFLKDCERLEFKMDGGNAFIEKYGEKAWNTVEGLKERVDHIEDTQAIGNALVSQWRYFNHWSSPSYANEETKEWFLMLFRRMKALLQ